MEVFCCKCGTDSYVEIGSTNITCQCDLFSTDISYLYIDRSNAIQWDQCLDILPANCLALTHNGNKCLTFMEIEDALEPVTYLLNPNE